MIRLRKNRINSISFTFNERATLGGNGTFVLELHEKTNGGKRFLPLNVETVNNDRRNVFIITEVPKDEEDIPLGTVNLTPGQYSYFAWETLQDVSEFSGGTLFFTAATDSIVESGRLIVTDTGTTQYTYDLPKPTTATTNNEFTFRR
jgi:hypothetical protein